MYSNNTRPNKIILPVIIISLLASATVMAKPFWSDREGHMGKKLEHFIEKLDLNAEQEAKAELILSQLKEHNKTGKHAEEMRHLIMLNPEDGNYLERVDEHANRVAEQVKAKIIHLAEAKQALYDILDSDQKLEMEKMIERRISKIEKRMKKHAKE